MVVIVVVVVGKTASLLFLPLRDFEVLLVCFFPFAGFLAAWNGTGPGQLLIP